MGLIKHKKQLTIPVTPSTICGSEESKQNGTFVFFFENAKPMFQLSIQQ